MDQSWMNDFAGSIIVCDADGTILYMNDKAALSHEEDGGKKLIGSNMLSCHPEPARSKARALLENNQPNIYTIEKRGVKKLVYQTPWHKDGQFAGLVEMVLEIPFEMPHFLRAG